MSELAIRCQGFTDFLVQHSLSIAAKLKLPDWAEKGKWVLTCPAVDFYVPEM